MTRLLVLPCVLALVLASLACGDDDAAVPTGTAGSAPTFQRVNPAELTALLAGEEIPLINVHIPYEGEIDGTDAFIPYNEISSHLGELPADRSARFILYCMSGRMSTEAAGVLAGLGYTNVLELQGGMLAWERAGFTVEQRPR